jgi:type III restriction enzyme
MTSSIDNPILNSPYEQPDQHYEIGRRGPTGAIRDGRRPSESFIPIAMTKKGRGAKGEQQEFDFDATGERRERNTLINDIRRDVAKCVSGMYPASHRSSQAASALADRGRESRIRSASGGRRDGDLPQRGGGPSWVHGLAQATRAREPGTTRPCRGSR